MLPDSQSAPREGGRRFCFTNRKFVEAVSLSRLGVEGNEDLPWLVLLLHHLHDLDLELQDLVC
jgi:hypothetical protein